MRERDAFGASAVFVFMPWEGPSKDMSGQINPADGYEWLEHPEGSGVHDMRAQKGDDWSEWRG